MNTRAIEYVMEQIDATARDENTPRAYRNASLMLSGAAMLWLAQFIGAPDSIVSEAVAYSDYVIEPRADLYRALSVEIDMR
jgi:hypothetical protein